MIVQNPKAEVAPFFVGGNRGEKISFGTEAAMNGVSCQTPGEEVESSWTRFTDAFKPS